MTERPSPYELWKQAGGEDDSFDKQRYRELLIEHGHLVPLTPGEKLRPLPCGWPNDRYPRMWQWLETAHLTNEERVAAFASESRIPSYEELSAPYYDE